MRIIFIGSGDFSVPIIKSLNDGFDIELCITRPDKKRGRGKKIKRSVMGEICDELGIETFSPPTINSPETIEKIKNTKTEIAILASYSEILSTDIIQSFSDGVINVHPSLLPKYRGAEPVRWAIKRGEKVTGVTLMLLSEKLDRGNILSQKSLAICSNDDNETLQNKLISLSNKMLPAIIKKVSEGFRGILQPQEKTFYARRMNKKDEIINWNLAAEKIQKQILSMSPKPGCFTTFQNVRIKLFEPEIIDYSGYEKQIPGTILEIGKYLTVACKKGALRFFSIQREGKKRMSISDFLSSRFLCSDDRFISVDINGERA